MDFNPAHALGRRDVLRALAACLADLWLPRRVFAQRAPRYKKPDRRVIVVTFGGGVRFEDTLAPQGWVNIPHLAGELVPKGLVCPVGRYEGLTGHFNSTAAMATGCRQDVDAYGGEAPLTPTIFELFRKEHSLPPEETWVVASNKSFGLDDRRAFADRMMPALDEGYEGFGWKVHQSGRELTAELRASLAKSLLDYFNDPAMPTSGDELALFMTKEIMTRLAPSLMLVNFWDIDIAHYGAYSLYIDAIRRTDRLVYELWNHAQSLPQYRDCTTLFVVPELGRDGDVAGNGFANHRSGDESCRRVWLVAVGAGVPAGTGTDRPIRTSDVAPTVARILGFKMQECEGRALPELAF
jgi:hypothetical protein